MGLINVVCLLANSEKRQSLIAIVGFQAFNAGRNLCQGLIKGVRFDSVPAETGRKATFNILLVKDVR